MTEKILEINALHHTFGDRKTLRSINLSLKKGETIGLVGKSGAGKSTLLKLIAGFIDIQEGTVKYRGHKIIGPSQKLVPGYENIRLVNQEFALDLYHTVEENIRQPMLHLPNSEIKKFTRELISLFELNKIKEIPAHEISGGEKQRLAIARALASEPEILLLDEPFSHLDSALHDKISRYIKKLQEVREMSIILAAHDARDIFSLCDKVIYIKNGRIKRISSPLKFYSAPTDLEEARFFGEINSIKIGTSEILFRPHQYQLQKTKNSLELKVHFVSSRFVEGIFHNFFETEDKKQIILYNFESLNDTQKIFVIQDS